MNTILEQINSAGGFFVEFAVPMLAQSSVLIVILLLADLALRKKVRAVFRYWLWMLILVKLALPSSLSSPMSVGYWFGDVVGSVKLSSPPASVNPVSVPEAKETGPMETASAATPATPTTVDVEPAVAEPAAALVRPVTWQGAVFLVWLAVVTAMGLLLLQRAIFVSGLVAQAKNANNLMNDALKFCCRTMKVNGKIGLKVSANAASPAVCGLFRPVILVPENLAPTLGAGHLRTVLLHELAHIKRGDLWVNLAQTILQIIYFYNPLLWLANCIIRRVREQAVDEAVQVAMGEKAKQYPETLVNVAKVAFKRPTLSLRLIGVVESKSTLQARIKRMLNRPIPKNAKLGILGLITVLIFAAVLLPMAAAKDKAIVVEDDKQRGSQFIAKLPNGVTVELVGICDYPDSVPRCWQPNGSALKEQMYVKRERDYEEGKHGFILRVEGPADLSFAWNKIEGSKGWWGSCTVTDEQGNKLNGFEAAVTKGHNGRETTNIRVGIATGPWETIATHHGRGMTTTGSKNILFSQAYQSDNFVSIIVSSPWRKDQVERIIAVDRNNQRHTTRNIGSVASGKIDQMTTKFYGLKLEDIAEFEFQTRPYQWVEFKNVSLKPNYKTDVQVESEENEQRASLGAGLKEQLQRLVEDFFKHNYRDITARKTIEWGEPTVDAEGNMSIRYKYEATIWDKDKIITDQLFVFDKNGKLLSFDKISPFPVGSKQWLQERVEEFFKNNYRDVTERKTIEWGEPISDPNNNYSIRYKYEATIWNKDKIIDNKVFTFNRKEDFISVADIEGYPKKLDNTSLKIATNDGFKEAIEEILPAAEGRNATLLDIDTGKWGTKSDFGENDRETHKWIRENKLDLLGVFEKEQFALLTFDMAVLPVKSLDWKRLAAKDVIENKLLDQMEANKITPMMPMEAPDKPATYLFRTRENGVGILQIISFTEEPKGVIICYKMVHKTDVQVEVEGASRVSEADKMISENLASEGWQLWRERKLAEAEKVFKKAVQKDATNANAWNGLGWSQLNQGKRLNAKHSFKKCLDVEPKHAAALNGLGWIAKGQGKTNEAIGHWEKAVEAAPTATAALNGLATTYMELEQYDKAVKYYEMWLNVEPDNADAKAGLEKAKAEKHSSESSRGRSAGRRRAN